MEIDSKPPPTAAPAAPKLSKAALRNMTNPASKDPAVQKRKKGDQAEEETEDMRQMQAVMGFGGFRTTKQTKVPGNDIYVVAKQKKTTYRQYMNRVGGFNRPLSPSR